jgi:hypothetical protein
MLEFCPLLIIVEKIIFVQNNHTNMNIKDLKYSHPLIFQRCLEAQKEQEIEVNEDVELLNAFTWNETIEGEYFWNSIASKEFEVFYKRYSPPFKSGQKVYARRTPSGQWSKVNYVGINYNSKSDFNHVCSDSDGRLKHYKEVTIELPVPQYTQQELEELVGHKFKLTS